MKGMTYFDKGGFSLNEGRLPNLCVSWWDFTTKPSCLLFMFYCAISRYIRFYIFGSKASGCYFRVGRFKERQLW